MLSGTVSFLNNLFRLITRRFHRLLYTIWYVIGLVLLKYILVNNCKCRNQEKLFVLGTFSIIFFNSLIPLWYRYFSSSLGLTYVCASAVLISRSSSIPGPWPFHMDSNPWIRTTGLRIRILFFVSVNFISGCQHTVSFLSHKFFAGYCIQYLTKVHLHQSSVVKKS